MQANDTETYDAFVSYRQAEPDRRWARWLEDELEGYRTPKEMVRAHGVRPRLSKVFRDEDELAATSSLTEQVTTALRQSRFLIVVCSPRAAASPWVNAEITYFCGLGRADRVLALLIEGEPATAFPPALRELKASRHADTFWQPATGNDGPLAPDVRAETGANTREGRRIAKLRLLAALLNCQFDDLRQREKERQKKRLMLQVSGMVALLAAGLVLWQSLQRRVERQVEELHRTQQARQLEEQGRHELLAGDPLLAARDLEACYESLKSNPSYQLLLDTSLRQIKGLTYVLRGHAQKIQRVDVQGKDRVVSRSLDGAARVWDLKSGQMIHLFGKDGNVGSPILHLELDSEGHRALFVSRPDCYIYDFDKAQQVNLQVSSPSDQVDEAYFAKHANRVVGTVMSLDKTNYMTKVVTWDGLDGSQVAGVNVRGSLAAIATDPLGENVLMVGDTNATSTSQPNFQTRTVLALETSTGRITGSLTVGAFDDLNPSRDGKTVLIAHKRAFPAVYSARSFQKLYDLHETNVVPLNAYWSPSGKLIRSPDRGGLSVWDAATGKRIRTWANLACTAAAIDPADSHLATVTDTGEIEVFEIGSGKLIKVMEDRIGWQELQGFFGDDSCLRFSADGRFLIFAGNSSVIKVWDWSNCWSVRQPMATGTNGVVAATFSPDGARVAFATVDNSVIVADSDTGTTEITLQDSAREIGERTTDILFSADGKSVLTGSLFGKPRLWDVEAHKLRAALDFDKKAWVLADTVHIAMSPSGNRFLTLSSIGRGALWDLNTIKQVGLFEAGQLIPYGDVQYSADGSRFIVAQGDGRATVFDSAQGRSQIELGSPGKSLFRAEIGPFGTNALAVDIDGLVTLWNISTGKKTLSLNQNGPRINDIHFNSDGSSILAAAADGHVRLWSTVTGKGMLDLVEEKLGGEPFDVGAPIDLTLAAGTIVRVGFLCARISPDGNFIAAGNDNGRLSVWDGRSGKQLLKFRGHVGRVTSLAFDHEGKRLVTCGEDGQANVWNVSASDINSDAERENTRRLASAAR